MKRTVILAVLLPLLVGCTLLPSPEPTLIAMSTQRVELGGGLSLTAVGDQSSWSAPTDEHDCAILVHQLTTPTGDYQVALLRAGCPGTPRALNGFHGYFVTPPSGVEVATATTPIGPAQVFSNGYEECTNRCGFGTDEVALVRVGKQTLQVIATAGVSGDKRTRDRGELVGLLQGLSRT